MFRLYQTAKTIRTWLGRDYEECDEPLLGIPAEDDKMTPVQADEDAVPPRDIQSLINMFGTTDIWDRDEKKRVLRSVKETFAGARGRKGWQQLALLFSRPYWNRVWIQHEIARQENVMVHFGATKSPLALLYCLYDVLSAYKDTLGVSYCGLERRIVDWARYRVTFALLRDVRLMRATDQKDKIYGAAGLSSVLRGVAVNYSLLIESVYIATFRQIVIKYGHLDLILDSASPVPARGLSNLPSWCPDWSENLDVVWTGSESSDKNKAPIEQLLYGTGLLILKMTRLCFKHGDRALIAKGF